MSENHIDIVAQCQYWVEQVIIKWSICPFAKAVWQTNDIGYHVVAAPELEDQVVAVLQHVKQMKDNPSPDTNLLIFPHGCDDFTNYLVLLDVCNDILEQRNELSFVQLASFHPDYLFADEDEHSASHFTNRAPWPILHIIRQSSIANALQSFPDPESIPSRNIELMQQIGSDTLAKQLQSIQQITAV